jgi:hypothetical protein
MVVIRSPSLICGNEGVIEASADFVIAHYRSGETGLGREGY